MVVTKVTVIKPSDFSKYSPHKCGVFTRLRCLVPRGGIGTGGLSTNDLLMSGGPGYRQLKSYGFWDLLSPDYNLSFSGGPFN